MTSITAMFPSKYLKAADLQDRPHIVKMNYIRQEEIDQQKKPVLYFVGKEKGLVLNKTNADAIVQLMGTDDITSWAGGEIEIYPTETDYQGKRVPCIRVRMPRRQAAPAQDHIAPNARTRAAEAPGMRPFAPVDAEPAAFDDEIPF